MPRPEIQSSRLEFVGPNHRTGVCRIEVLPLADGRTTIIATELAENTGTSITNAAEQAATEACRRFNIDPHRLVWIEHYNSESYRQRSREETYDLVSFSSINPVAAVIFDDPDWKPMTAADWENLGLPSRSPTRRTT